jgi:hypothetical protein
LLATFGRAFGRGLGRPLDFAALARFGDLALAAERRFGAADLFFGEGFRAFVAPFRGFALRVAFFAIQGLHFEWAALPRPIRAA